MTTTLSLLGSHPTVIDDDIRRMVDNILGSYVGVPDDWKVNERYKTVHQTQFTMEVYRGLLDSLTAVVQVERNGWKEKLHSTLQEMDRQHRASIAMHAGLQDMADNFGIVYPHDHHSQSRSADLIRGLQIYIQGLQHAVNRTSKDSQFQIKLNNLQEDLKQLEKEKADHTITIHQKMKEIGLLRKELNTVKSQLHKPRRSSLNYNEMQSFKQPGNVEEAFGNIKLNQSRAKISRELAYVEEDRPDVFAERKKKKKNTLWTLRARQSNPETGRTGIAQCLRCQQLFKTNENNAMSCHYHKKGREIREQYDQSGRLSNVLYNWACCKKGLDAQGCTSGFHI